MTTIIAEREKGQFPISIGTSLALEGALGIYPEQPLPTAPLLKYQEVWFNVYTLFRNLMASMTSEAQRASNVHDLYLGLQEDILGCKTVLEQEAKGRVRAIFYLNDYSKLPIKYPHAKFKVLTTDNQLMYQSFEENTLKRLMREPPVEISQYKFAITGHHPPSLILTHFPVDLFARYQFSTLNLLESHTGKIKPPAQWNTKLTGKKEDTSLLPFNEFTLQIFGDSQQFVHQPIALKRAVIEVASKGHWSPVTTLEKIKTTLPQYVKDKTILEQLQKFF